MAMTALTEPCWDEAKRNIIHCVGVDLGQVSDFTAICVLQRFTQPLREVDGEGNQRTATNYHVVHLERPALGTSYPLIVQRIAQVMRMPDMAHWEKGGWDSYAVPKLIRPGLCVDQTGVGRPIVDLLRDMKLSPVAVTITGGDNISREGSDWRIPKRNLISQLQLAFQNRALKIAPSLPLAATLANELQNFRLKINLTTARDSYEAWREGMHDDLVLSAALALWYAEHLAYWGTGGLSRTSGW
jgi:hypothetical protein